MEPQRLQIVKAILEKNKDENIFQSYSNQKCGTDIKTDMQTNGREQKAQKKIHAHMLN